MRFREVKYVAQAHKEGNGRASDGGLTPIWLPATALGKERHLIPLTGRTKVVRTDQSANSAQLSDTWGMTQGLMMAAGMWNWRA